MLAPNTPFVRVSDYVVTRLDGGELALLHISSGMYYTLNGVGAYLWELLASPQNAQTLSGRLVADYDVTPPQAEADVAAFLDRLLAAGLLLRA